MKTKKIIYTPRSKKEKAKLVSNYRKDALKQMRLSKKQMEKRQGQKISSTDYIGYKKYLYAGYKRNGGRLSYAEATRKPKKKC